MGFVPLATTPLIIALGDSITQFGADLQVKGFQALLSQDYIRKADVVNRGLCGWTTRWWRQYLPQLFGEWKNHAPILVMIALGANDASLEDGPSTLRYVPLDEYKENLIFIAQQIQQAFPPCKVFFLTPPAVDNSKWDPKDKLNEVTCKYAQACVDVATQLQVPVIDLWTSTQGQWDLLRDGVHPSAKGNALFHQLIQSTIASNFPHLTPNALPLVYPDLPPSSS